MNWRRLLRHLSTPRWRVRRAFSPAKLRAIEAAIKASETRHSGQVCFAVESALEVIPLLHNRSPRQRALDVFAQLHVWDTEHNNGVLIYLLLADRQVEILADRGAHSIGADHWERRGFFPGISSSRGASDGARAENEQVPE